jgi:hypothetical protein
MRKLIIATTLTVVLAGTASAAEVRFKDRNPRERDAPIVRVIKAVKRLLTINNLPTVPHP